MSLIGMHKSTFGIDVGHRLVKVVELRYDTARSQTAAYASFVEVYRENTRGPASLAKTLKRILPRRLNHSGEAALAVCGRPNVVLKRLTLRGIRERDLMAAAVAQSAQYLPLNGQRFIKGFSTTNPIVSFAQGSELAFLGVRRGICEFYDEVLRCSHRNPVAFEAAGLALAAAYQRASLRTDDQLIAILDVGECWTKLLLLGNGRFLHYDEVAAGCGRVVLGLQRALGVSVWPAVVLLSGRKAAGVEPEYAARLVTGEVNQLTEEVKRVVRRSLQAVGAYSIDRALLCGGGASLKPVAESLSGLFRYGAVPLDPFRGLPLDVRKVSKVAIDAAAPMFAVAMGLALRARYARSDASNSSYSLPGHKRLLGH